MTAVEQAAQPAGLTCERLLPSKIGATHLAVDPRRKAPGRPATGRQVVAAERCQVLLKDRCPAYITWQQYEANRKRLADNRCRAPPPRRRQGSRVREAVR